MRFYVANAIGIAAVIFFVLSYQQKTRQRIVACNVISRVLYVLQYILLGAFEGAVLDILGVMASVAAQQKERPLLKRHRTTVIAAVNTAIIIGGLLVYENGFSLLPICGVLLHTGAFWLTSENKIRWISLIGSPFWLVYNLVSRAYGSALGDAMTIGSIALALVRYRKTKDETIKK